MTAETAEEINGAESELGSYGAVHVAVDQKDFAVGIEINGDARGGVFKRDGDQVSGQKKSGVNWADRNEALCSDENDSPNLGDHGMGGGEGRNAGLSEVKGNADVLPREGWENGRVFCFENGRGSEFCANFEESNERLEEGPESIAVLVEGGETMNPPQVRTDHEAMDVVMEGEEDNCEEDDGVVEDSSDNRDEMVENFVKENPYECDSESAGVMQEEKVSGDYFIVGNGEVKEGLEFEKQQSMEAPLIAGVEPINDEDHLGSAFELGGDLKDLPVKVEVEVVKLTSAASNADLAISLARSSNTEVEGSESSSYDAYVVDEVQGEGKNREVEKNRSSEQAYLGLRFGTFILEAPENFRVVDGDEQQGDVNANLGGDELASAVETVVLLPKSNVAKDEEAESNQTDIISQGMEGDEQERGLDENHVQNHLDSANVLQDLDAKEHNNAVKEAGFDLLGYTDSDDIQEGDIKAGLEGGEQKQGLDEDYVQNQSDPANFLQELDAKEHDNAVEEAAFDLLGDKDSDYGVLDGDIKIGLEGHEQERGPDEDHVQNQLDSANVLLEFDAKEHDNAVEKVAFDLLSDTDSDDGVQEGDIKFVLLHSSVPESATVEIEKAEAVAEVVMSELSLTEYDTFASDIVQTDSALATEEKTDILPLETSTSNPIPVEVAESTSLDSCEDLQGSILQENCIFEAGGMPKCAIAEASNTIEVELTFKEENDNGENIVKDGNFAVVVGTIKLKHETDPSDESMECRSYTRESSIVEHKEKASLNGGGSTGKMEALSNDAPAMNGVRNEASAQKRQFIYIVRHPRYPDNEKIKQIQLTQLQLVKKTQIRDSMNADIKKFGAYVSEFRTKLEDAKTKERDARNVLRAKREERDSLVAMLDRIKNATSADSISEQIYKLEHMMQHETLPLKQEKQYMADIKRLKQQREELLSRMGQNANVHEALDQRKEMEQRLKELKRELDALGKVVSQAENNRRLAKEKYDQETMIINDMKDKRWNANDSRQKLFEELTKLNDLKKQYWAYRKDKQTAHNLADAGDREGLVRHCENQVTKFMEMWNSDDEFRLQYVKANTTSTVRRFMTLDGRSLGVDEVPIVLNRTVEKISSDVASISSDVDSVAISPTQDGNLGPFVSPVEKKVAALPKVVHENQDKFSKKAKRTVTNVETIEGFFRKEDDVVRDKKLFKEEEDIKRKAEEEPRIEEERRKEKLAAELKEQHRLEQQAKAAEAEERKRKQAEKAQLKAEYKAQKEAELKEKKRVNKEKKKKVASTETPSEIAEARNGSISRSINEPQATTPQSQQVSVVKVSRKPLVNKNKEIALPPPLRKRGKRKMTSTWILVATFSAISIIAAFFVFRSGLSLPDFFNF